MVTLAARGPFGLSTTSNFTLSPSLRVRKPSARISEWWTNTSGPPSRDRKPKPLASLNHLTVPSIMNVQASLAQPSGHVSLRAHDQGADHCDQPLLRRQTTATSARRTLARGASACQGCESAPRTCVRAPWIEGVIHFSHGSPSLRGGRRPRAAACAGALPDPGATC